MNAATTPAAEEQLDASIDLLALLRANVEDESDVAEQVAQVAPVTSSPFFVCVKCGSEEHEGHRIFTTHDTRRRPASHHERESGYVPRTIREVRGVEIVRTWERLHVGKTDACAYRVALVEAETYAAECRREAAEEAKAA